jgi:acyl-CoA dehydrogenase
MQLVANLSADVETIILDTAQRIFAKSFPREVLRRAADGQWLAHEWRELEEAGLPLGLVEEAAGGFGLDSVNGLAIVRLAAQFAVPLPLADTMLANYLMGKAGITLREGPACVVASSASEPLSVDRQGEGWRIAGRLAGVVWPEQLSAVVTIARRDGSASLVRIPRSAWEIVDCAPAITGHPAGTLEIAGEIGAEDFVPLPAGMDDESLQSLGAALRTIMIAGSLQKILELTASYLQQRTQFGRPLSRFQVVQHEAAKIAAQTAAAGASADMVAEAFGGGADPALVAAAKSRSGEAAAVVAGIAHQMHGAIGVTEEYELHHFTRQLWAWRSDFGGEAYWNEQLGRRALAAGAAGLWPFITGIEA